MKQIIIFITLTIIMQSLHGQSIIDTIITEKYDTIPCQITFINNYSIFYKYPKGKKKRLKDKIIPRIDVIKLVLNNKGIKVPEKKIDSGINEYYRKSKLNRKYEILLLKENTDKSLKILADSTFKVKQLDYFYLATKIQSFAKMYKCKLIYITDISPDKLNIKLFDASDEFYNKTLNSYKKSQIYFLRTNNKMDFKEQKFKINDKSITLNKDEYYKLNIQNITDSTFTLKQKGFRADKKYKKDSLVNNEYYYIGHPNYYSDFRAKDFGIFAGAIAGGIIGGGIVFIATNNTKTRLNNFVGEFIITYIDKTKE